MIYISFSADQKVGLGLGKAIQQARTAKKMTQAKLAQAINEKPAVINQYENGKAIPNGQVRLSFIFSIRNVRNVQPCDGI